MDCLDKIRIAVFTAMKEPKPPSEEDLQLIEKSGKGIINDNIYHEQLLWNIVDKYK